jgi:hypothetical protein
MPALHPPTAVLALAEMNRELAVDRTAGRQIIEERPVPVLDDTRDDEGEPFLRYAQVEGNGFGCTLFRVDVFREALFTARQQPYVDFDPAFYERLKATGLQALTERQLGREWQREDGASLRIERCLIDANWGTSTDVVYQFCRQSAHAGVVLPSHGRFVGASSQPFSEYKRRPGDRVGLNWRIPNVHGKRAVRHALYDTNYWKTFVHARLAVPMGDRGCLSLFGDKPETHRLFAEHLTAEYRVKTEGRGRTVDEWKLRPERGDNHWLDCLVGCAVAASIQGVVLPGTAGTAPAKRERVSFAAMQRRKQR